MDYSQLSDFEIDCKVAYHIGLKTVERAEEGKFKPCSNPTDAWPIIVENKICLEVASSDGLLWLAEEWNNTGEYWYKDANPLRAAMIVFLQMQDANNV